MIFIKHNLKTIMSLYTTLSNLYFKAKCWTYRSINFSVDLILVTLVLGLIPAYIVNQIKLTTMHFSTKDALEVHIQEIQLNKSFLQGFKLSQLLLF